MREVSERDLRAVARFLRTPGLSRQVIGDLLGESCENCKRLLAVFASTFEFRGETSTKQEAFSAQPCILCKRLFSKRSDRLALLQVTIAESSWR